MRRDATLLKGLVKCYRNKKVTFTDNNEGTIIGKGSRGSLENPFLNYVHLLDGLLQIWLV